MKKKILVILMLVFLLCLIAIPAAADSGYQSDAWVVDGANILSQTERNALSQQLSQLSQTYQTEIRIFTTSSTADTNVERYAEDIFDDNQLGYGDDHSGILLLLCMDIREFCIFTNGAANDAIGSWEIEKICDTIVSDMSDGNYYAALDTFLDQCDYYLDGHINGFPFETGKSLLIAFAVAFVIALIITGVWKAQLKSVRKQHAANVYVRKDSMHLTAQKDFFLYKEVNRTRKETTSSSGSGSSRSSGSRKF